jgi:hypothetical protein
MLSYLVYRLRALFRRTTVEAEMNDELHFHFEQEVSKHCWSLQVWQPGCSAPSPPGDW